MVTLERVARDHQGHPVTGLRGNDFHVFEQVTGWRKEKREQKIAVFKPMGINEPASENLQKIQAPAGVYTNQIAAQASQVPPTILLVDGLNTEVRLQMQVHAQMVDMVALSTLRYSLIERVSPLTLRRKYAIRRNLAATLHIGLGPTREVFS
jgi:hypothetical protein